MPTRTLATMLLQYHQKEMLVTRSTSFTGLGRFPCIHIQTKFTRNTPETASANPNKPCWHWGSPENGRAHVWTPVTDKYRIPSSACKKKTYRHYTSCRVLSV